MPTNEQLEFMNEVYRKLKNRHESKPNLTRLPAGIHKVKHIQFFNKINSACSAYTFNDSSNAKKTNKYRKTVTQERCNM